MNFFGLFGDNKQTEREKEIQKIFSYLDSLTKQKDITSQYIKQYKNIIGRKRKGYKLELVHLYLIWEDFIVSQTSITTAIIQTPNKIRQHIAEKVNLTLIPKKLCLIFLEEPYKSLYVYEIFIQSIAEYIISTSGVTSMEQTLINESSDDIFRRTHVTPQGIDFTEFNFELERRKYTSTDIQNIFKGLYTKFFVMIESSFGRDIAVGFFNKIYKTLQEKYNKEFASIFLKIIPEQVLKFDDWLATLSKEELEREVQKKTAELAELNNSLERKVEERTEELQKAYAELQVLDKRKSEFISVAAHQLRTPLSGFKWSFDMLINEDSENLKPEQIDLLKQSHEANERMLAIVNDMLNTDLIGTGKSMYEFNKFKVFDSINEIIAEVSHMAKQKNVTIIEKHACDTTLEIQADKKQLEKVIQNYIDNAIKYTLEGGTVTISASCTDTDFAFSVSDTGIGIEEKEQKEIFTQFYRAENAIRTHANGSGLGLFIVKGVIDAHHGTVSFKSKVNVGSTFSFTIPKIQQV